LSQRFRVGAQLSTSHSLPGALGLDRVMDVVERTTSMMELDSLIVGARENPEIFRAMTDPGRRPAKEVFLWYNLLSDIEDMQDSDLVVNWRGERSHGWGGWAEKGAEVNETFRFVCPNNPTARDKTLRRLRELLARYPFEGIFLDKMRFPSPANGLDEDFSCFCDHCRRAAAATSLDLDAVARSMERLEVPGETARSGGRNANSWLDGLGAVNPLLSGFLRFRQDSITNLIAEAHEEVSSLGRRTSLDLFSPGLAVLVGQDYRNLSKYCAWAKPMTYRVAKGPAGLRLEIPALVEGIARTFNLSEASISNWASHHVPGFDYNTLERTREFAVPLSIMTSEITDAARMMHPVPIYFGLELVSHPGVVEITPSLVSDMMDAGREAKSAGCIISWDLMHAPMNGIEALAAAI